MLLGQSSVQLAHAAHGAAREGGTRGDHPPLDAQALAKAHDSLSTYRVVAQIDREDGGVVAVAGGTKGGFALLLLAGPAPRGARGGQHAVSRALGYV